MEEIGDTSKDIVTAPLQTIELTSELVITDTAKFFQLKVISQRAR